MARRATLLLIRYLMFVYAITMPMLRYDMLRYREYEWHTVSIYAPL